jgi:hypothetical protein
MSLCAVFSHVQSFRRRFRRMPTSSSQEGPLAIRKIHTTEASRSGLGALALAAVVTSISPFAVAQTPVPSAAESNPQSPPNQALPNQTLPNQAASNQALSNPGTDEQPNAVPSVSAPFAVHTDVEYPPNAEGNAVVVLRFVVQVDGSIRDVEVLLGDEPFASAAAASALTWRFYPARRDGQPVAARIDFEVTFEQSVQPAVVVPTEQPNAPLEPTSSQPATMVRGSATAAQQDFTEVTVQESLAAGTQTLSRAAARQIPGAFGDPMRGVDLLPGVTPTVSGLPFFYVRGAPPANTGFYFDGVRLPFLYHAFLGPSIIHPELIDAVHLHSGPVPTRYGGNAGGVVEGDMRAPSGSRVVNLSLGVFDAGGMVDAPFADGKGRLFLAGRYSYVALAASLFSSVKADFWNYQGYATYALTPRDNIGVLLIGAYDLAQQEEKWESEFHIADVRWDHSFGPSTNARIAGTIEYDSTEVPDGRSTDFRLAGRATFTHRFSEDLRWESGINGSRDDYDLNVYLGRAQNEIFELFPSRADSMFGAYTELAWDVSPRVKVVPGLRVERYSTLGDKEWAIDPRITATYKLTDSVQTTHGFGISHQTPNWLPNVAAIRVAGLGPEGLQKAVFTTSGIEARLPNDWVGSAAVFHNAIFAVTDPFGASQSLALEVQERALGRSYGLELALRRSLTRRFGGMLSYTLSRTTRTYDDRETLSGADRTHVINLAGLYTLGANWRLGARAVGYSGYPGRLRGEPTVFNQSRAPFFFRADVRVERRFRLSERSYWSIVGELLNATGSPDVLRRVCHQSDPSSDRADCNDTRVGPLMLPNVKVEAVF